MTEKLITETWWLIKGHLRWRMKKWEERWPGLAIEYTQMWSLNWMQVKVIHTYYWYNLKLDTGRNWMKINGRLNIEMKYSRKMNTRGKMDEIYMYNWNRKLETRRNWRVEYIRNGIKYKNGYRRIVDILENYIGGESMENDVRSLWKTEAKWVDGNWIGNLM